MAAVDRSKTYHFMALDGLRGVAALIVVAYHSRLWIRPVPAWHGYLAVDLFFLLSGFVIAHAYGSKIADGKLRFHRFAISRAIRLYPMIALGAVMGTAAFILEAAETGSFALFTHTIAAFPFALVALPQVFLKSAFDPNGPAWSLFFEIIANIAYFFSIPRLSTRWVAVATAVFAVGLALAVKSVGGVHFGWAWPTMPIGLLRVGFPFAAGVLLQRLYEKGRLPIPGIPIWVLTPVVAAILAMPVLGWRDEILYTWVALFIMFPLIVASGANDRPSDRWIRFSAISAEISFPIYLTHSPILHFLELTPGFAALPLSVRLPLAMALCIAFAILASRYYDEPVRAWLKRLQKARSTPVEVTSHG